MTYNHILPLINKRNFILSSRRDNEAVFYARRGGATQKLDKISLPEGNLDFAQSLRYFDSVYMNKPSSTSLDLGQNQDFNLGEICDYKSYLQMNHCHNNGWLSIVFARYPAFS